MIVYKCPKNCHIRIYPLWVGDDAEKCPRCGEWMVYKGDLTDESLRQMQEDSSKQRNKSKKQLKKRKKK